MASYKIKQGSTPTITVELGFDPATLASFSMDFVQEGAIVLTKQSSACTIVDNSVKVNLAQSDTLGFSPARVGINFRGLTSENKVVQIDEIPCVIERSVYREVIA